MPNSKKQRRSARTHILSYPAAFVFLFTKAAKNIQYEVTAEGPFDLEPVFAFLSFSLLTLRYRDRKWRIKLLLLNAPQLEMPKKKAPEVERKLAVYVKVPSLLRRCVNSYSDTPASLPVNHCKQKVVPSNTKIPWQNRALILFFFFFLNCTHHQRSATRSLRPLVGGAAKGAALGAARQAALPPPLRGCGARAAAVGHGGTPWK